jgi:ATP synthase subunit 6
LINLNFNFNFNLLANPLEQFDVTSIITWTSTPITITITNMDGYLFNVVIITYMLYDNYFNNLKLWFTRWFTHSFTLTLYVDDIDLYLNDISMNDMNLNDMNDMNHHSNDNDYEIYFNNNDISMSVNDISMSVNDISMSVNDMNMNQILRLRLNSNNNNINNWNSNNNNNNSNNNNINNNNLNSYNNNNNFNNNNNSYNSYKSYWIQNSYNYSYGIIDTIIDSITSAYRYISLRSEYYLIKLYSLLIFILTGNLIGLIPYTFTVTSYFTITISLSLAIIATFTIICILRNGILLINSFIPTGTPLTLAPLLLIIETLSYSGRSISLGTRLAANILAGHSLLHIITSFTHILFNINYINYIQLYYTFTLTIVIVIQQLLYVLPLLLLITLLLMELIIAVLQGYVFLLLTIYYLSNALILH